MVRILYCAASITNLVASVNASGVSESLEIQGEEGRKSDRIAQALDYISRINNNSARSQYVGHITIFREPTSLFFAALHYTHNKDFDMDEIYKLLIDSSKTSALHLPSLGR